MAKTTGTMRSIQETNADSQPTLCINTISVGIFGAARLKREKKAICLVVLCWAPDKNMERYGPRHYHLYQDVYHAADLKAETSPCRDSCSILALKEPKGRTCCIFNIIITKGLRTMRLKQEAMLRPYQPLPDPESPKAKYNDARSSPINEPRQAAAVSSDEVGATTLLSIHNPFFDNIPQKTP